MMTDCTGGKVQTLRSIFGPQITSFRMMMQLSMLDPTYEKAVLEKESELSFVQVEYEDSTT